MAKKKYNYSIIDEMIRERISSLKIMGVVGCSLGTISRRRRELGIPASEGHTNHERRTIKPFEYEPIKKPLEGMSRAFGGEDSNYVYFEDVE